MAYKCVQNGIRINFFDHVKNTGIIGASGSGKYLRKTVDLFSMPGLLILSHESKEQVESDYNLVRKLEQKGLFVLAASQESKTTKI
ncbi:TPA: hypothetical protein ACQ53F_002616 [Legionella pneumophila]|jgi:sugar diacid utilization regulator|uniref:Uncharacterized protein n=1 Tax=Legionella pneumophila TaxID=446 RepID=A0AAN5KT97_LEGPN|nr:hypothetical protein [Legionella pneumophila]HAT1971121.1 hypothetical protein [Legionella pneumophila]HAT6957985.1 hypothetical protein [Legionella pneumophila]HEN4770873.1 hypothetical protein [Legionella pneumophila]